MGKLDFNLIPSAQLVTFAYLWMPMPPIEFQGNTDGKAYACMYVCMYASIIMKNPPPPGQCPDPSKSAHPLSCSLNQMTECCDPRMKKHKSSGRSCINKMVASKVLHLHLGASNCTTLDVLKLPFQTKRMTLISFAPFAYCLDNGEAMPLPRLEMRAEAMMATQMDVGRNWRIIVSDFRRGNSCD